MGFITIFWILIVAGLISIFFFVGYTLWVFIALWILAMAILAGNPNHRVNVWANYLFLFGVCALMAHVFLF